MITTLKMLIARPRPLHVIPTHRAGWRVSHMAGLLAATALGAALLAAALSGHNAAQAGNPGVTASVSAAVGIIGGAIDHSVLNNPELLPEPNAALLHSDPNAYAYAGSNAADMRESVTAKPQRPASRPPLAGTGS
jgi:hypothetical protein